MLKILGFVRITLIKIDMMLKIARCNRYENVFLTMQITACFKLQCMV